MLFYPVLQPVELHIPDGFLSLPVALTFWAISAVVIGFAVKRSQKTLGDRQVPLMGVMAAFIFAAQMINFPIAGGTSGHLLGGALAAIILGPWAGILVMSTVVGVQALFFQDGGLVVLGANLFNMGILTSLLGFGLYRGVKDRPFGWQLAAAGTGAWLSVLAGALATAIQLWLSGTTSLQIVLPAMLGVHALIGLGEAAITAATLAFIHKTRPDLIQSREREAGRGWAAVGLLLSLAVVLISPWASASPDGLERVAIDLGFIQTGQDAPYQILPDYTLPLLGETGASTILAGALGLILVTAVIITLSRSLQRKNPAP